MGAASGEANGAGMGGTSAAAGAGGSSAGGGLSGSAGGGGAAGEDATVCPESTTFGDQTTRQDFSELAGDACAEVTPGSGTHFRCTPDELDTPAIPGPRVLADGGPAGRPFLRLARFTELVNGVCQPDRNSIAFDRTTTGVHPVTVADFDFRMTTHIRAGEPSRADGMSIVFLNTEHYGDSGVAGEKLEIAGIIEEEPSFKESVGVALDIYKSGNTTDLGVANIRADLYANTVSLHYDKFGNAYDSVIDQFDETEVSDLASSEWHHLRVVMRGDESALTVSVYLTPPDGVPVAVVEDRLVPGAKAYPSRAWFGARSGCEAADFDIADVRVESFDLDEQRFSFVQRDALVGERAGTVELEVERSGDTTGPGSVAYSVEGRSAEVGRDFEAACGRLDFAAGETRRSVALRVLDDDLDETSHSSMKYVSELVPESASEAFSVKLGALDEHARLLGPATATVRIVDDEAATRQGHWGTLIGSRILGVHAYLLPNGKVLYADRLGNTALWSPELGTSTPVHGAAGYNLFCNGAAFLPDGRLLFCGGHHDEDGAPGADHVGVDHTCAFDATDESFTRLAPMNAGRWYPSVTVLSNGSALVLGGSIAENVPNLLPQVYLAGSDSYTSLDGVMADAGLSATNAAAQGAALYPWLVPLPGERVLKAGPDPETWVLDTMNGGAWSAAPNKRLFVNRNYGSAVALIGLERKVALVLGGGDPPTASVEELDLTLPDFTAPEATWVTRPEMATPRRHHNATPLPDGRVLVTGGCAGPGGSNMDTAVTAAEIYEQGGFRTLPPASVGRCYHSFALLLPDGSVLTGGGGQGGLPTSLNTFQIYYPDYFDADRPEITALAATVSLGQPFTLEASHPVARVTALRLGAPTHSFDQNARYVELAIDASGVAVSVTAPNDGWMAPGHYLVFALDAAALPSRGKIVRFDP
jgi:hypothetical protein